MEAEQDIFVALSEAGRITNECGKLMVDAAKVKQDKLLDIIRRVIANPSNAKEVADEIAIDWFPVIQINPKGVMQVVVGSGRKR